MCESKQQRCGVAAVVVVVIVVVDQMHMPQLHDDDDFVLGAHTSDYKETEAICQRLLNSQPCMIGMDTETTVRSVTGKESLLQLCVPGEPLPRVYLFHLYRLSHGEYAPGKPYVNRIPPSLRKILNSVSIIKVGVDIENDVTSLAANYGIEVRGVLELQKIARATSLPSTSLLGLAEHFGIPVGHKKRIKTREIMHVDWDREPSRLPKRYVEYAARDAYMSYKLARRMLHSERTMKFPNTTVDG
jgi:ribonuclease D